MSIICTRCVMDDTDFGLKLDDKGQCNHCHYYDSVSMYFNNKDDEESLLSEFAKIKESGKGNKYDSLIGLSGGVDSSYVVYLAYKYNLRPLIVHLDNGWDSKLAIQNIKNIIRVTNYDVFNYKVDTNEFYAIQRAYLESHVIDVEVPSDMAIISIIKKIALQYDIKYILSGLNVVAELTMGKDWNFSKMDRSNFNAIINQKVHLKTFPNFTPKEQLLFKIRGIQEVNVLQYVHYDSRTIKERLRIAFSWEDYSVKHGESIFTLFYQSIYLPRKYNVDKRKAHFSDLIRIGEMTREEALNKLANSVLSKEEELNLINEVAIKLGYTYEQFEILMAAEPVSHSKYPVNEYYGSIVDKFFEFILRYRKLTTLITIIYGKLYC